MSATAIITMILVLGFVWGGLLLIIVTAARKEGTKRDAGGSSAP